MLEKKILKLMSKQMSQYMSDKMSGYIHIYMPHAKENTLLPCVNEHVPFCDRANVDMDVKENVYIYIY